jgi:fatty acid desaturase
MAENGVSTVRIEAEVARRHSPAFAWPTLALAIALVGGFIVVTWAGITGRIPLWLGGIINTLVLYAIYTPLHDAIHSAIVPRRKGLRWINTAVGMACAAPIWMFFHHHRKSHFLHHARTNMPEDPDLYAEGSFVRVFFLKIPWALAHYFNPAQLWRECRRFQLPAGERVLCMALFAIDAALALAALLGGHADAFLALWLIPWFVGNLVMLTTFGWAPHHDHSERGRYRDTRISLFPGGDTLYLGQNLHLIHHMLPSVPFYRYRAVFDELRPVLERQGARIEGFWPYSRLPTVARP